MAIRWILIISLSMLSFTSMLVGAATDDAPVDRAAIRAYLQQFKPSDARDKEVAALISQLGANDFMVREGAMAALRKQAVMPRRLLTRALENDDAEIRSRAKQILEESGDDDVQRLSRTLQSIAQNKVAGLASDMLPAMEHAATFRSVAVRAFVATTTKADAKLLSEQLRSESAIIREGAAASLAEHLGKQASKELRSVLNDSDDRVVLIAAKALANVGDRASLAALVRLLESKRFETRYKAARILRFASGQKFSFDANASPAGEAVVKAIEDWQAWVKQKGESVALRFPLKLDDNVQLFNGSDLAGWQAVNNGAAVQKTDIWQVKNGVIVCNGSGKGYLRTQRKFTNYKLTVDYQWPNGGGDSGIWLMMPGPDGRSPRGLEIQLLAGKAGDFWALSGFTCKVRGQNLSGYGPKIGAASEKPLGQWNTCETTVLNGKLTVKINGVEQNNATDLPKEPGYIALQVEGTALNFRRVELKPLGP